MVGNPCLPSVVPLDEHARLWMKLDCQGLAGPVLHG